MGLVSEQQLLAGDYNMFSVVSILSMLSVDANMLQQC